MELSITQKPEEIPHRSKYKWEIVKEDIKERGFEFVDWFWLVHIGISDMLVWM
jgi:hypothetical protein